MSKALIRGVFVALVALTASVGLAQQTSAAPQAPAAQAPADPNAWTIDPNEAVFTAENAKAAEIPFNSALRSLRSPR